MKNEAKPRFKVMSNPASTDARWVVMQRTGSGKYAPVAQCKTQDEAVERMKQCVTDDASK